jgi:ribokinase
MILVFGSINIDLAAIVLSIPRPGETVLSDRVTTSPGGKGANQAVAAARARTKADMPVVMAGAVGGDSFGALAVANLAANGVETGAILKTAESTGCAFIVVDRNGENAITVASGANRLVRAADVPEAMLRQARVVMLQLEIPIGENITLARRARSIGARVILNLAPFPVESAREQLAQLLEHVDILVLNELEAHALAATFGGASESDPAAAAQRVAKQAKLTAVITRGAKGAVASVGGGAPILAPALAIKPVDTTGAGDAFVGVLAARLADGHDLAQAMRHACAAASLACLGFGAQASLPWTADIESALRMGAENG